MKLAAEKAREGLCTIFFISYNLIHVTFLYTMQAQSCADAITLDRRATERKLNGAKDMKSDQNLNKPEPKSRAFKNAAKMVQQVASVKMFLSSFKKDSEYVFVEIPKRPDGK